MFSIKKEQLSSIIKNDLPASIVVFLIALPLCLGIALASGAPLFAGLITGIIGGLVVSVLSGSSLSVTGPAAGLTVIVLTAITDLGAFDSFLMALCIAGVLQLLFGFLKAGNIANFFPSGVIKGMLAAIGLILILKQIPHALGYDADFEGDEKFLQADNENTFTEIINAFVGFHPGAVIISIICFMILIGWENKFLKKIKLLPAPLIVVIAAILLNELFNLINDSLILKGDHLVQVPLIKSMTDLATNITFPNFAQWQNPKVYITAATIAIVASLETLLSIEAIDKLDPARRRTPGNRELKAQGIGNLLAGLIGGLPMTAVIVRGSANINSGAKSKASAFIHGAFLLLSILLIPSVINLIPLSALACILIITGYKLAKISMIKQIYAQGREQFIPFVATIVAILFTDLLRGIAIGMLVAAYFILRRNIKNPYYLNSKKNLDGNKVKIVLAEEVSFLNKPSIIDTIEALPNGTKVTIDGGRSKYIDSDVVEFIEDFKVRSVLKNIEVNFVGESVPLERKIEVPVVNGHDDYHELFKNNREWVQQKIKEDGSYFENMAEGQTPKFLWIGCSDSRVHPNSITGTDGGEMFIHRNIANLVVHTDMNLMSVLQYSVEVLKVEHVIVCGHYGCGGIKAATDGTDHGLIDKWLRNIKDVYRLYSKELDAIQDVELKQRRLVELNVREQVYNLSMTSIIQKAKKAPHKVKVYGWVYDIREGLVHDLKIDVEKDFSNFNIYKLKEKEQVSL